MLAATAAVIALTLSMLTSPLAERAMGMHWRKLLLWNASASAPIGLYLLRPPMPLTTGELVTAILPDPVARIATSHGYLPSGTLLLKHIAALPAQTVCRTGHAITIDRRIVAFAEEHDHSGRQLLSWSGCRVLQQNEAFLLNADVSTSFDGRYFGVIPASAIAARAIPLWTTRGPSAAPASQDPAHLTVPFNRIRDLQNQEQLPGWGFVTSVSPAFATLCSTRCAGVPARTIPAAPLATSYDAYVQEAAGRFNVPFIWIAAVMRVESNGNARAVSPKGAMGLMQLMPATWIELAHRYRLGDDPFDPRDNILAGTAYLRELYDRFGPSNFLAAYHAGPARVGDLAAGRPPWGPDTEIYLRQLARMLPELPIPTSSTSLGSRPDRPTSSPFVATSDPFHHSTSALGPQSNGLFVGLQP